VRGVRFLFTARAFHGHLFPMAGVAAALRDAGHEVTFASGEGLRSAVEELGFDFVGAWEDEYADWDEDAIRARALRLAELVRERRPDVVVRDQTELGGLLAAEPEDVPAATLGPSLYVSPRVWRRELGDRLDRVRTSLGLPPDPGFERLHPYLYLDPAPPWYQLASAAALRVRHPVRLEPPPVSEPVPAWVDELPEGRTVLVTFGTVFNRRPELFRSALEGLADLDLAVAVAVAAGPGVELEHVPPNARVAEWLPLARVLPRCGVVIAHGGFGTAMAALWFGVPSVLLPLGSDNWSHARRCVDLGLAVTTDPAEVTPAAVRALVDGALHDRELRERVRRRSDEMRTLPDAAAAAELLVRLARERRPLLARVAGRPRRTLAVVIPVYGRDDLTHAVLGDVAREPWVEPVVVDNRGDYVPVRGERVLRPGRNLGWAGGCNHALEELRDEEHDAYVLLNNDTRLSPGFFAGLRQAAEQTGAALLGPAYDGVWPYQHVEHDGPAASYRAGPAARTVPFLDGTCLFVPRRTVEEVGLLDAETFRRHGWGVDFDYALRVRRSGGELWVTELAFLHHDGNGTADLASDRGWRLDAWNEMVAGMRRKWGQAWPRRLRGDWDEADPRAPVRRGSESGPRTRAVFVVGTPAGGVPVALRAANRVGVPPLTPAVARRLDRLGATLADATGVGAWHVPADPADVLRSAPVVTAVDTARAELAPLCRGRPWLWYDRRGALFVPFWAAALDVEPVVLLVVRDPIDAAAALAGRTGCSRRTALAVWERRLRQALTSLVGLPVLVSRYERLVDDPDGWAVELRDLLEHEGIPLLASNGTDVASVVEAAREEPRSENGAQLSPAQRALLMRLSSLEGSHEAFPEVALLPETPDTDELLARHEASVGARVRTGDLRFRVERTTRLRSEWAAWIAENRRHGVADEDLVQVLVDRGVPAALARRELGRVEDGDRRYHAEYRNPLQDQLDGWTDEGYRLARPARETAVGLLASLCAAGFTIETFAESDPGDPDAPPASASHLAAYVPPSFTVVARREPVA
jgi:UDP:flavonoid glycosyltransferase YjiC (YdhE family)/GT2 family glycosyltransferase